MKKIIMVFILINCFLLTACNSPLDESLEDNRDFIFSEFNESNEVKKDFNERYINEHKLPILDVHIENPFISGDRVLVLDDTIENNIELMIYEYYKNRISGEYEKVKETVVGRSLTIATENEEKDFNEGIYYNKITLDEIDVVDKTELNEITEKNKQLIIEQLDELDMEQFAIVEVEKIIKLNEKYNSVGAQVADGEVTRYYLVGKKDNTYKIVEVYWKGLLND